MKIKTIPIENNYIIKNLLNIDNCDSSFVLILPPNASEIVIISDLSANDSDLFCGNLILGKIHVNGFVYSNQNIKFSTQFSNKSTPISQFQPNQ